MNSSTYRSKYNPGTERWLEGDQVPRPPVVSDHFLATVVATDFSLTDEHDGDNTQEALLGLTSGFSALAHYTAALSALFDKSKLAPEAEKRSILGEGLQYMEVYDATLDRTLFLVADALRDLDRRIVIASTWAQMNRPLGRLPTGQNPAPLAKDDPRMKAWRAGNAPHPGAPQSE